MQEIVEELPEDADLSTDPGHSQQMISEASLRHSQVTPTLKDEGSGDADDKYSVGPEPVAISSPTNSDLGPDPVNVPSAPEPEAPTQESTQSPGSESTQGLESAQSPGPESIQGPELVQSPVPKSAESPVPESSQRPASVHSPVPESAQSPVLELVQNLDQESSKRESKGNDGVKRDDASSLSSEVSTPGEEKDKKEHKYATLSRVRKFKVDGQVMQSTTRKIVDVTANRTLRDNKKYQQMR